MSETRFTPGPWWVEPMHASIDPVIRQASGRNVIACKTKPTEEEDAFNDLAMASAPELYGALIRMKVWCEDELGAELPCSSINAALAKARGEVEDGSWFVNIMGRREEVKLKNSYHNFRPVINCKKHGVPLFKGNEND